MLTVYTVSTLWSRVLNTLYLATNWLYNLSMKVADEQKLILQKWLGAGSINIFGRPFSGKDTQGKMLSNLFNAPLIGGGDIIRGSKNKTINNHVNAGFLAPQKEYLSLVLPYLSKTGYKDKSLILCSLGRWYGEEKEVLRATRNSGHKLKAVINLEIDEATVISRWEKAKQLGDRGFRNDDNINSIKTRLDEFNKKTVPVLEFYKQHDLLIQIDGLKPRQEVEKAIINALLAKAIN